MVGPYENYTWLKAKLPFVPALSLSVPYLLLTLGNWFLYVVHRM